MANIREIQSRINSVKDTMKITNAMYMISSSKMTHAKKKLADTEPYFYGLQGEISRILRHLPDLHHGYFSARENVPEGERKIGSIVITADKGLAGAYNHNIVKLEEEILARPGIHKLFIVGELGRHYFAKRDVQIDTNFQYTVQNPTMHRASEWKPEKISVVSPQSGMIRLIAATRSRYHSRVYLRFISFKMRELPLCTGRWICLHTFGTWAITSSVSSLISFGWEVAKRMRTPGAASATIRSSIGKVTTSPVGFSNR